MESIKNFSKFEGNEISNLKAIRGGGDTGPGERCLPNGDCQSYQGDVTGTMQSGDPQTTYWGTATVKKEC